MIDVARNARTILKDRGLKQSYIAKKAGYTVAQFSGLLCGRKTIKANDITRLCIALDVI